MGTQPRKLPTKLINAKGTFTPVGVSRSSNEVCSAVSEALRNYFVIDELQDLASETISSFAGSEAATVTHCTASGITVSIAATMTGTNPDRIAALPDSSAMANVVVIPAGHNVNYGQSLVQAVRLSGANPVFAGDDALCTLDDLEQQISNHDSCCLLLTSSKLVQSPPIDFAGAIEIAHSYGIPAVIDAAAQDFRIRELVRTNADLVLISAQKYLASPTAGLVIGRRNLVDAVRAQENGIGRGMKATKESILGVLAAIEEREKLDILEWQSSQDRKTSYFVERANMLPGMRASVERDPTGLPFSRVVLNVSSEKATLDATTMAAQLKAGSPSIWVMDQNAGEGEIGLELVQVTKSEIETILSRLSALLL